MLTLLFREKGELCNHFYIDICVTNWWMGGYVLELLTGEPYIPAQILILKTIFF